MFNNNEQKKKFSLKEIINFLKQTGFVFSGSEIYNGLANSFDYGPLGSLLKNNIKKSWIKKFIQEKEFNVLLDSSILMKPKIWEASGHLSYFIDLLVENKDNNNRYRVDHLIQNHNKKININDLSYEDMTKYLIQNKVLGTKNWSSVKEFNLLFKTHQGSVSESSLPLYLRPETCQGIFVNFKNILQSTRKKIPFGVGQIGKSFRNEITPDNFIFRTYEFEQMELEFFCHPRSYQKWFEFWKNYAYNFLIKIGFKLDSLKIKDYSSDELCHYSNSTTDILFDFPWGFDELWGISSRTDFDLKNHQKYSQKDLQYRDPKTKEKYWPFVIEPSLGVERLFLAIITNSLTIEKLDNETQRIVLKIHPYLSPYKLSILPLIKKKHSHKAKEIYLKLSPFFQIDYDETQSIGKRYRRQDMIGTPFCCTIDDQTLIDDTVTIRERDTLLQKRKHIEEIKNYIENKIIF
ncbi:MAG: glycine--tRNA ligase [Candidatus Phytoplasma stylosanthis]|uniref:glycine--tRNA ligase n=1 Tax=Candidatus Phytoplasma stylosanthis TaxID=2798314 RepID=UPI00293A42E7|nr:glycine--tRNA ligase [Candidatus Phytoplasma stylosanthis]MDV3167955.1 glycine--tRNA ligase [Candidatus Phytoplasma stylosanthis]MDV3173888.1 glycine--tRNA ligase [Candidatus Phytoplasma stylosanthis]MDV3174231.1 glycine--tRNA ligase [Candidatus Phytoplasma stylosanthis]